MIKRSFIQRTDEVTELTYQLGKTALRRIQAEDAATMTNPASSDDEIAPMGWAADESKKEQPETPPAASDLESKKPEQAPQLIEIRINPETRDVNVNYVPSPDEILADVPGVQEEETPEEEVVHEPKQPEEFEELQTAVGY